MHPIIPKLREDLRLRGFSDHTIGSYTSHVTDTHLKVTDIDSKNMRIRIQNGKGGKDRYTILARVNAIAGERFRYLPLEYFELFAILLKLKLELLLSGMIRRHGVFVCFLNFLLLRTAGDVREDFAHDTHDNTVDFFGVVCTCSVAVIESPASVIADISRVFDSTVCAVALDVALFLATCREKAAAMSAEDIDA